MSRWFGRPGGGVQPWTSNVGARWHHQLGQQRDLHSAWEVFSDNACLALCPMDPQRRHLLRAPSESGCQWPFEFQPGASLVQPFKPLQSSHTADSILKSSVTWSVLWRFRFFPFFFCVSIKVLLFRYNYFVSETSHDLAFAIIFFVLEKGENLHSCGTSFY